MADIKILSMQRVRNHGSFLQSFALKSLFESCGANVSFIDIVPGLDNSEFAISAQNEFKDNKKYKNILGRLMMKRTSKIQNSYFQRQAEAHLKLCEDAMKDDRCDIAVIGSDEVFNCANPAKWGFTLQLFGNIPGAKNVVTYAASCGRTTAESIPEKYKQSLNEAMHHLKMISVRDKNTVNFVNAVLEGAKVEEHLDPVLIYDFSSHVKECPFKKKFLLLYSYTNRINNSNDIRKIKEFAKKNNLEIVCAGVFQYWCKHNIPVDSFELLGYFKAADYVLTDTFHGTIMSVIMRRKFATIVRDSNRNKLVDLLERLELTERIIDGVDMLEQVTEPVVYEKTAQIIEKEQQRTQDYINAVLQLN